MSSLTYKYINSNHNIGDTKSFLSVFLEVPFFFNNNEGSFYRFESSVYNFLKESSLKNYSLEFSMNLKQNFKILKSMFFGPTSATLNKMTKPLFFYSYLFSNSLSSPGLNYFVNNGNLFMESVNFSKDNGDYFLIDPSNKILNYFYKNNFGYLSDTCVQLSLPSNKINSILYTAYFNVDTFVSSYSSLSSYFDFDTSSSFIFNIKFPRQNLFMLGSQKRSTSFFVKSLDSLTIFSAYTFFLNN